MSVRLTLSSARLLVRMSSTSSTGSRKRAAATATAAASVPGGVVDVKRPTRSRRAVKIEVEKEEDTVNVEEKLTVSKYFSQDKNSKATVKSEPAINPNPDSVHEDQLKLEEEKFDPEASHGNKVGKRSPEKKKLQEKVVPPEGWETILENIKIMRSTKTAAVDTMGCERTADLKEEPKVQRFQTLVSLMLSSQTKDQVTFAAMERLKERGLTVQSMLEMNETELGEILKPVGFYRRKATYIKKAAQILRVKYDDDIPRTIDDLCALPGVGPKMAYICMNAAWNEVVGIGVDTHVHRIANRLKWTGKKGTGTPEKTREALESWMPNELWQDINILLVGFGQETCLPVGPKCESCLNKEICPASTFKKTSTKK